MEKDMIGSEIAKEIEILEFRAGGNSYGVDVSDIREILPYQKKSLTIPNAHPCIEGIIKPRDFLIPIINFMHSLKLNETDELKAEMLIVTSIADLNIAFHVDSVKSIHRAMTTEIAKPGKKLSTSVKGVVIGILQRDDRKIEMVDFRKIINDINPQVNVG
jgi:two-component system chemotaxis response regulator CheV